MLAAALGMTEPPRASRPGGRSSNRPRSRRAPRAADSSTGRRLGFGGSTFKITDHARLTATPAEPQQTSGGTLSHRELQHVPQVRLSETPGLDHPSHKSVRLRNDRRVTCEDVVPVATGNRRVS
jgi:hypothetical protein